MIEYRIRWAAGSNSSFHGASDWEQFDGTPEEAEEYLVGEANRICPGLEYALEGSGFEWWVETR